MANGKRILASVALALALISADVSPVAANVVDQPIVDQGIDVVLRAVATLPDAASGQPPRINGMAHTGDRLFVLTSIDGLIYELRGSGPDLQPQVFFDVKAAMAAHAPGPLDVSNAIHGGLRSVAFHPDFETNGLFYVSAMITRSAAGPAPNYLSDVPDPIAADSVLIEFQAVDGVVDPASYREVFRVGMPVYDHTIRQILFNPYAEPSDDDYGLLYVAHGDGSVRSAVVGGGQNNDARGKILRIDPRPSGTEPYSVPSTNPFVGDSSMLDEVYSLGHRNPHHLAFALVNAQVMLLAAEPGRDNVEEINRIEAGGDYGWPQREGTFVHLADGGVITGVGPLPANDAANGFHYPAAQFGHDGTPGEQVSGLAVAGGFAIDNGSELSGLYFFADFVRSSELFHSEVADLASAVTLLDPSDPTRDQPSELSQAPIGQADIFLDHDQDPATPSLARTSLLDVFNDAPTHTSTRADVRFGQGPDGALYITSKRNNTIYRVENSVPPPTDPPPPDEPGPADPPENELPQSEPPAPPAGTIAEASTINDILRATDYTDADAEILRLYRAFFDREPDIGGAKFWLAEARAGRTVDNMGRFFASSDEFVATYGPLDDEAFMTVVYRNVMDRAPDQAGFEFWIGQLNADPPMERHRVMLLFAFSPEFIGKFPYAPTT